MEATTNQYADLVRKYRTETSRFYRHARFFESVDQLDSAAWWREQAREAAATARYYDRVGR